MDFKPRFKNHIPKKPLVATNAIATNSKSRFEVPSDPEVYWDAIGKEIIKLGEIMKKFYENKVQRVINLDKLD